MTRTVPAVAAEALSKRGARRYREAVGNPIYPPLGKHGEEAGYENCEFFAGSADGLFHILCTWDGGTLGPPGLPRGVHPHFVVNLTQDPLAEHWTYVGAISVYNASAPGIGKTVPIAGEPTPVYEGGPPGDGARVRGLFRLTSGLHPSDGTANVVVHRCGISSRERMVSRTAGRARCASGSSR
eukprot:COSAG04_NODE_1242_length_7594_cov_4.032955_4_plen_183_part_00